MTTSAHAFAPTMEQRLAMRQRPAGFPVLRQRWSELLFLHWPISPEVIQASLPKGLYVDTFDGQAWVGIVPFYMDRVRPVFCPPVPGISWFLELNVRTYVHDETGEPGVWFYSLDCNLPLAVAIARRFYHLPYEHAEMLAHKHGEEIHYASRREDAESTKSEYVYAPSGPAEEAVPGSLEFFLVERYLLYAVAPDGGIRTGRVHHAPYRVSQARCEQWSTEPMRLAGLPEPVGAPSSRLYCRGVDVRLNPLRARAKSH